MSDDFPQLAADIIAGLPPGATPADARRALQALGPLDQTAALAAGGGGGGGGGAAGAVLLTAVELTSADILTVGDPVIPILPAPGADKCYFPQGCQWLYRFGTTPYSCGNTPFQIGYGADGLLIDTTYDPGSTFVEATTDWMFSQANAGVLSNGIDLDAAMTLNQPIVLTTADGAPTDGDGTMSIRLWYLVADFST